MQGKSNGFIILTTQRSGSTWFVDTLNRYSDIKAYGELFLAEMRSWDAGALDYPRYIESAPSAEHARPRAVFDYLDGFYRRNALHGFKMMYGQLGKFPEVLYYLRRRRLSVIHLIRQNYLDVIISKTIKQQRKAAHHLAGGVEVDVSTINLPTGELVPAMRALEQKTRTVEILLRRIGCSYLLVRYEDFVADPLKFNEIREFLGLNSWDMVPQSVLKKIAQRPHAELLANYDEVSRALAGTRYESLLH